MGEVNLASFFDPLVEIFDPSGARVGSATGGNGASVAFTAGRTGTYTAVLSDVGNDVENSYRVSLAVGGAVSVADAAAFSLGNGEDRSGFTNYGDFDLATFEVDVGETVRFGFGEINPASFFDPLLEIFDPAGNRVATDTDDTGAAVFFTAATSGVYTAIFSDSFNDRENSYRVTLAIPSRDFEGEVDDSPVPNGGNVGGSLDYGDFDMWRFEADAGEAVRVGFGEISPASFFDPVLEVYAPSGAMVGSGVSSVGASVVFTATESGEYRALVYDSETDVQNSYRLTLAVAGRAVTATADSGPLANGATSSGLLNYGDFDIWTFDAEIGKTVRFGFGEISPVSFFEPELEIFDPTGTTVARMSGDPGVELSFVPSVSGTYSAIISDNGNNVENSYEVSLAISGTPFETAGRELTAGVSLNGGIGPGNFELYAFRAAAGDAITLNMSETSSDSSFDPRLEVYSADGNLVFSGTGSSAVTGEFVAISGGNYFVVASEDGVNRSGSFTLTVDGFTGGAVVFDESPPPTLFLRPVADANLLLSWENDPAWSLMNSPDLRAWSPGPDPVMNGGTNEVLIAPREKEFFRLER